jgi:hypothetical protein
MTRHRQPGIRQNDVVATWGQIEQDAPEFAARVRSRFDVGTNKTIATGRRPGLATPHPPLNRTMKHFAVRHPAH